MKLAPKIGIGSGVLFVFIIIFGWVAFPKILTNKIKSQMALKPNGELRKMYVKVPFALTFKVYLFNVTNYKEVAKGDIPVVDEIGPYVFDEWKEKVEELDNDADDTLTYRMKDTWVFNKQLSGDLTGDEIVMVPHPFIIGMVMYVLAEKPSMMSLISKAILAMYDNPETPFLTVRAMDLLFDGFTINCPTNSFAAKGVCTKLKTDSAEIKTLNETTLAYSLFGSRSGVPGKRFKVSRGIKVTHDLGKVIEFENQTEMDIWPTKACNQFEGTDSTIFPPFLTKEEGLVSFAPDMCRSLKAVFDSETVYDGIPCYKYTASLGDMSTDPDLKCYCPTPDTCLKKGLMDLTKCTKVPIYASLPHFYDSDSKYVKGVRGLHPNEKDHGISILFETMTGSPLSAHKRLQFSFPLAPVPQVECMKSLPNTILPFFWVEEGVDLNSTFTGQLKNQLFKTIKIFNVTKWIILVSSLGGLVAAGYLYYRGSVHTVTISPVKAAPVVPVDTKKSAIISMINPNDLNKGVQNRSLSGKEFDKY